MPRPPGDADDRVLLDRMTVECIVGILPHERRRPQPLEVAVEVGFARRPGAFGRSLQESLDYDRLEGMLRFVLVHGRFLLIEEAAEALAATALAASPRLPERCRVTVHKPRALAGRAVPGVGIERLAGERVPVVEPHHDGAIETLHDGPSCRVLCVRIPSGGAIPAHRHDAAAEAELALDHGLHLDGRALDAGIGHAWPAGFAHAYRNTSPTECRLLRVVRKGEPTDAGPGAAPAAGDDPAPCATRVFGPA
jgi:FolB domain-containing protein